MKERAPVERLAEDAAQLETLVEAANGSSDESTIRSKKARFGRFASARDSCDRSKRVDEMVAGDVRRILDDLADAGASKQSCLHVRNDFSAVLGELWRGDMLPENAAAT